MANVKDRLWQGEVVALNNRTCRVLQTATGRLIYQMRAGNRSWITVDRTSNAANLIAARAMEELVR